MAHLATMDPSEEAPSQQLLVAVKAKLGRIPNMMKVMANSPAVLKSYIDFSGNIASGALSAKLREQIALLVAQQNECHYCLSAHSMMGKIAGLTLPQIEESRSGIGIDQRATAALQFAALVLEGKGHVGISAVESVRSAGYNDGEIAEIIANVALNVFTNYFNSVTDPEIDFPPVPASRA